MREDKPLLEVIAVSKSFPGVRALDNVDFSVAHGEVHGLIGENGAGKSTLIKILAGAQPRDRGEIRLDGQPVEIESPHRAQELGIAVIHQELQLVPFFSALENIMLGGRYQRNRLALLDWNAMERLVRDAAAEVGIDFNLRVPVSSLSVAQQWLVAITKALIRESKLVVMDEPTASLSDTEVRHLFAVIRALKARGVSVVYVSHRLEEVFEIADRVTVMKDGQKVGTLAVSETNERQLIALITGKEMGEVFPKGAVMKGREMLAVEGLSGNGIVKNVSFQVGAGEILGIGGLVGAGRTELVRLIFGADPKDGGEIYVDGRPVTIRSPIDAIAAGIVLLPEDRKTQGGVMVQSVRENITLASIARFRTWSWGGPISRSKESAVVFRLVQELNISTRNPNQQLMYLSGGNQQKTVLAKWLCHGAKVFIFDEPTKGVDIGGKSEIYHLLRRVAGDGAAVIFISSELPELIGVCDRILVLREGEIVAELDAAEASEERILHHCYAGLASKQTCGVSQ